MGIAEMGKDGDPFVAALEAQPDATEPTAPYQYAVAPCYQDRGISGHSSIQRRYQLESGYRVGISIRVGPDLRRHSAAAARDTILRRKLHLGRYCAVSPHFIEIGTILRLGCVTNRHLRYS